jgi:hypothetical protein
MIVAFLIGVRLLNAFFSRPSQVYLGRFKSVGSTLDHKAKEQSLLIQKVDLSPGGAQVT